MNLIILLFSNPVKSEWSQGGPYELNLSPTKEEAHRQMCSKYYDTIKEFQQSR